MLQTVTKETALIRRHLALHARMVPFAGYNMPLQYSGVVDEHHAVRKRVGVFDVSHMGEFILKGDHAMDLVQYIASNDAAKLTDGKAQYSCMPNDRGGIVDDLIVYRLDEKTYMLVVNAANIQKDWEWISRHNKWNVEMKDVSDRTTLLAIQGPEAAAAMQKLTPVGLKGLPFYTFAKGAFAGVDNVLISATGYTGSGGFEIYFDNAHAERIWDAVFEAGSAFGIKPAGLGARDTLRLEMGYCLYGNDITDETSPLEAGLGWITKFTKAFVHSVPLLKQKEEGIKRRLVGFEMVDRGIPRKGYVIRDASGKEIGTVTSGTHAPSLGKAIGMGYVTAAFKEEGSEVFVDIRNSLVKGKVVKIPFYKG